MDEEEVEEQRVREEKIEFKARNHDYETLNREESRRDPKNFFFPKKCLSSSLSFYSYESFSSDSVYDL